ncbi:MAG TPA: hypothetical protein VK255_01060 [Patescibacteria group bacterium]|nr:hypothetical protein [Patescibacteria group bacterium]
MANGSKNNTEEPLKKTTTKSTPQKKEEASGGLMAVIIALVAIIIIAGSVGAFFLFVKLKKDYFAPKNTPPVVGNVIATEPENILGGTGVIGVGDTSPIPVVPTTPTVPIVPEVPTTPTIPTPTVPEVPAVPEPDKVGKYDFDGAISGMDTVMNQTYDTSFNNSVYSNDYFGF